MTATLMLGGFCVGAGATSLVAFASLRMYRAAFFSIGLIAIGFASAFVAYNVDQFPIDLCN